MLLAKHQWRANLHDIAMHTFVAVQHAFIAHKVEDATSLCPGRFQGGTVAYQFDA